MLEKLTEKGVRITIEAEKLLEEKNDDSIQQKLIELNKPFIEKEDVEKILSEKSSEKKVIVKGSCFHPVAKEYDADIKVMHKRDVTGKSRTKGEVDDFVDCFRNRFERISRMLRSAPSKYPTIELKRIKSHVNEKVRVIATVSDKRETKKGNLLLEIEDKEGNFKVVVPSSKDRDVSKVAGSILLDDILAITGRVMEPYMIADEIHWPDLPITKQKKLAENDVAVAYISDIHFGSKYFLERYFKGFIEWLHCKGEAKELAGKVKYVVVAGDIIDGIGIFPNQEKELVVKDIFKQYQMFDDFVENIPDYIEVIVLPGNHDAVRRGEPMPAIGKDLIKSDITSVGNPSTVSIEGVKHLLYHGTSIDSMIANMSDVSYTHPEKVMIEYLKRRHLSPVYGANLIIPEKIDYLVIEDEPDVLHCGHVHKNGYAMYRNTVIINSGTFQDRTEFQVKQGHVPTPAMVPVYELKTGSLKTLDFKSG